MPLPSNLDASDLALIDAAINRLMEFKREQEMETRGVGEPIEETSVSRERDAQ